MKPSERDVTFRATGDARTPYAAVVGGERWTVRVNDFPADPSLYSLSIDGRVVEDLMEWPGSWRRPDDDDRHERAEAEREAAHVEKTRHVAPSKLVK